MMYTLDAYDVIAENQAIMLDEYLKLESVHPIDIIDNKEIVLHEALISNMKISKTLDNIIKAIKEAIKKFKDISRQLKTKNSEWLAKAEAFDLQKAKLDNFREEIFPYWNAIPSKFNITIPKFDVTRDGILYEGDEIEFMTKYFKHILDKDGNINKNILRGLTIESKKEKFPIEYGKAKSIYPKLISIIRDIYKLRDKVAQDAVMISKTVERVRSNTAPINESTLLEYSMFKDEYFDILLEYITPDDIERENNKDNKDPNININREDNKKASDVEHSYKLVTQWSKMCMSVISAEMDILDEAYSECVKFIDKVMKSK